MMQFSVVYKIQPRSEDEELAKHKFRLKLMTNRRLYFYTDNLEIGVGYYSDIIMGAVTEKKTFNLLFSIPLIPIF